MNLDVREITINDIDTYRQLRLEMVEVFPLSFGVDINELRKHDEAWWHKDVEEIINDPDSKRFLAWMGGAAVGMAGVKVHDGIAEIGSMYVRRQHQGQGIGGLLIDSAIKFAEERGARTHKLWVHESNDSAIALYKNKGFAYAKPSVSKERFDGQGLEIQMVRAS